MTHTPETTPIPPDLNVSYCPVHGLLSEGEISAHACVWCARDEIERLRTTLWLIARGVGNLDNIRALSHEEVTLKLERVAGWTKEFNR
jgi:hypothetical protein